MGFDFKKMLGAVAPMLGAAFGGPLGGAAATAIVSKLGLNKADGTPVDPGDAKQLQDALTPLMGNPDTLLKLKEADAEFTTTMTKLGFDNEQALEKIAADDRASARQREVQVRDYTPEVGFYLLLVTFAFFMRWLFKWEVPAGNKAIAYTMVGSLGTLVSLAATYFYGTTRQSKEKDVLLANSTPVAGGTKADRKTP